MSTEAEEKKAIFEPELEQVLLVIQKMTQEQEVEYSKGDLMEFFANITVNLIANSGVCHECFQVMLDETFKQAAEQNILISHDTAAGHLH